MKNGWGSSQMLKVSSILASLILSATFIPIGRSGNLTPYIQLGVAASTFTLLAAASSDRLSKKRFYKYLFELIAIGVLFQISFIMVLPGLIGIDPHLYATLINAVSNANSKAVIMISFYDTAANYIVAMVIYGDIIGLSPKATLLSIPLLIGGVVTLTTTVITRSVTQNHLACLITSGVLINSPILARFAFWPIAQSYALVLFTVGILLLVIWHQSTYELWTRYSIVFLVVSVSLAFTHKFPILVLVGAVFALAVVSVMDSKGKRLTWTLSILGIVLFWLWTFPTEFLLEVVLPGVDIFADSTSSTGPTEFAAAYEVYLNPVEKFSRQANWLVLGVLAGLGWIFANHQRWRSGSLYDADGEFVVLGMSSLLMLLLALSVVAPIGELNSIRVLVLAIPILTVLSVVFIKYIGDRINMSSSGLVLGLVCLLLLSQVAAVGSSNFYPDQEPRDYLTVGEQDAKQYMLNYTRSPVYTDSYYVRAGNPIDDPPQGYWRYGDGSFQLAASMYYSGQFDQPDVKWVAHRQTNTLYSYRGVTRELEYNPDRRLSACGDLVYTNRDVKLYGVSGCAVLS